MRKELQCLSFPTALIYTMIKQFFFALGNACSECRFEVTPELELFLMPNLQLLKLNMQSQQTPLHTLHICIYLYFMSENCLKMIYAKIVFRLKMMSFFYHPAIRRFIHLPALVKE